MTTSFRQHKAYERDFYNWTVATAEALKNRDWGKVDLANLIEEVEAMGRSEKAALESNLVIVTMHLLKYLYQPEKRSQSWINSIVEHRRRIDKTLKASPSLKSYIEQEFLDCYREACFDAAAETGLAETVFPIEPPFNLAEAIDPKFQPWISSDRQ
jgi:hypothetical protein